MTDKLTFVLGSLSGPLKLACRKSGRTPSEEVRYWLAKSLKVKPPEMKRGFAAISKKDADEIRLLSQKARNCTVD